MDSTSFKSLGGVLGFRALGELLARARVAALASKTFGGARDLYEAFGYARELTPRMFRERYLRNDVAARLVEAKPEDTWRGLFEVYEDPAPQKETAFEKEWKALDRRLKIGPTFRRADILAGLGRYAVVLIGSGGDLEEPLERASAKDIMYLSRFAEEDARIELFDVDEKSARYGLPLFYRLTRTATTQGGRTVTTTIGKRVHHTRVVHISDGLLDDDVYGTPRLERHWNLLDDLEKVTGGGAEAFFRRADGGTQFDLDPTLKLTPEQADAMKQEVEDFVDGFKRTIRTRGMKINRMGGDVAGFQNPVDAIIGLISAGSGIPQRVLMGSEQGKLAAEQDSVKYYRTIEARRADYAEALIVRPFVERLIALGALPEPKEFFVGWSQIRTLDDDEKVTLAKNMAAVNQTQGETVITTDEIREKLGYEPLNEVLDGALRGATGRDADLVRALLRGDVKTAERLIAPLLAGVSESPVAERSPVVVNLAFKGGGKKRVMYDQHGAVTGIEDAEE